MTLTAPAPFDAATRAALLVEVLSKTAAVLLDATDPLSPAHKVGQIAQTAAIAYVLDAAAGSDTLHTLWEAAGGWCGGQPANDPRAPGATVADAALAVARRN